MLAAAMLEEENNKIPFHWEKFYFHANIFCFAPPTWPP